jgi:hypothetical protein
MDNNPSMLKATAIGGLAAGVLSSIPLIGCLNIACCSLLIGGGVLAAFLYSRDVAAVGGSFTVGNGAIVGLITAVFYTISRGIVGWIVSKAMGISAAESFEQIREQMESQGNMPPEGLEMLDKVGTFMTDSGGVTLAILGLGLSLVTGAIFCTIGGLIGGAVFKKEPQAPAPPTQAV